MVAVLLAHLGRHGAPKAISPEIFLAYKSLSLLLPTQYRNNHLPIKVRVDDIWVHGRVGFRPAPEQAPVGTGRILGTTLISRLFGSQYEQCTKHTT